jgi:hypothetical protein
MEALLNIHNIIYPRQSIPVTIICIETSKRARISTISFEKN